MYEVYSLSITESLVVVVLLIDISFVFNNKHSYVYYNLIENKVISVDSKLHQLLT